MVYNEIMENKYLIYRILIVFVVVTFVTNMAFVALQKNVVSQEKLKAQYTVNSTISRVEIKLESYIEKVGFLKKTIEAGIDLDDAYFESVASRLYGDDPAVKTIELAPNGIIQNVYPFKENQKAIGMDMLTEHERKRLLLWQKIQGNIQWKVHTILNKVEKELYYTIQSM